LTESDTTYRFPLFPLSSVVLPGGRTALRLFEARYMDLVAECLRNDTGFGICLIRQGGEAGEPALPYGTGAEVRIVDWNQQDDGMLGITVAGQHKIRVRDLWTEANQLVAANVEALPPEPAEPIPADCRDLVEVLARMLRQLEPTIVYPEPQWDDAAWVGSRLVELLPLPPRMRQYLVELDNPTARLYELRRALS
jgi:Lon protease-like protein